MDHIRPDRYVEAPADYDGDELTVFLAGGITGTADWQTTVVHALSGEPVVVLNPRRRDFGVDDDEKHASQVRWEHRYLHEPDHRATVVLMRFAESPNPAVVQPIAWYELGRLIERGAALAVGVHPGYARRRDVLVQLRLAAPDLPVHDILPATVHEARRLLLPQQLWRLGVDLTTRLLPVLDLDPAAWPQDPTVVAGQITTGSLGQFEEVDSRLVIPMRELRYVLNDLAATDAAGWTPVQVLDARNACRQFVDAAGTVGEFADLWPYPSRAE